jgi:hypothetical protein
VDSQTGIDRGEVQFASAPLAVPASDQGPQWLGRLDHNVSERHRIALRYIYDSHTNSPLRVYFPGFITERSEQNQNFLFTDHYRFSPTWTNEFPFSYARQKAFDPERISPQSVSLASSLPRMIIDNIATPGVPSAGIQFRRVNNWLLQVTQTKLAGRHAFRYGLEFLNQLAVNVLRQTRKGKSATEVARATRPSPTSWMISADLRAAGKGILEPLFSIRINSASPIFSRTRGLSLLHSGSPWDCGMKTSVRWQTLCLTLRLRDLIQQSSWNPIV